MPLVLRRSGRARRISLRVSQLDGRVTLTLPDGVPEAEAIGFARAKEAWIRKHLSNRPAETTIDIGVIIPVEGRARVIEAGIGRGICLTDDAILVPPGAVGRRVQAFLRALARDRLASACDRHAAALGRRYTRLTLRDTRSRWGSCSAEGRLMFSWRLILAPPEILDYVAAHEVAHLVEMNHSPAFWDLVGQIYGPHKPPRAWLRREGTKLHGFRFCERV